MTCRVGAVLRAMLRSIAAGLGPGLCRWGALVAGAGCGCRGGRTAACACVVRGDGTSVVVTGTGSSASPYRVSFTANTNSLGSPTNMVMTLTAARPSRQNVWWYSATGQVPNNFQATTDVLVSRTGFVRVGAVASMSAALEVQDVTWSHATLVWGPVAEASFYEVHFRSHNALPDEFEVATTTETSFRLAVDMLNPPIEVKVRARDIAGNPGLFTDPVYVIPATL